MPERRGKIWGFLLATILVAAGMASCAHPAWSQHPTRNPPPPPPRPPVHHQPPPQRQVVKPAPQVSRAPARVMTQPRMQQPGAAGASIMQSPAVGTRVNAAVPHPPVRPWEQRNADIPASERPPPGMCRVWLDKVPASSQPAPTSCAKAIQTHPANGHVIFGEDGGRPTATRVPPATAPESPPSPESPFRR